jgi:hypothetical protein
MFVRRTYQIVLSAFLLGFLLSIRQTAYAFDVTATLNNQQVVIGDLSYSVGIANANTGQETGTFLLKQKYNYLMDDKMGCQFRWFQIIIQDDCPAKYKGKPLAVAVDPPSGGWDYQKPNGGADTSPYYENDDNGNYAYPNYAQRHDKNYNGGPGFLGMSWTDDYPGICDGKNVKTTWQTYLVFTGPKIKNEFDILFGYQWTVGRDNNGNPVFNSYDNNGNGIDPTKQIDVTQTPPVNYLDEALNNSGFSGWKWAFGKDLALYCPAASTPELSAGLSLTIALLSVVLWHRYRSRRSMATKHSEG